METYKKADFDAAGLCYDFVQDNQSSSRKGVLRGLHFQKTHPQAKLVRVLRGEVFDVAVDLRCGSATFAHGFLVLSDYAEFTYKCDDLYHPEDEGGIAWDDPEIGIVWPEVGEIILSEKDKHHPTLKEAKIHFKGV